MKTIIYISSFILCIGLVSCGGTNKFSSDYNEIYYSAKKGNQNGQNNSINNSNTNTELNSKVKSNQNSTGNEGEKVVLNPYSRTNASGESNKQQVTYNQVNDTNQLAGEIDDQVIYPGDDDYEIEKPSDQKDDYEPRDKAFDSQKDDEVSLIDSLSKFQNPEFYINFNKGGYFGWKKISVPFSVSLSYKNYDPDQNNLSENANENQDIGINVNKEDITLKINERLANKINNLTRLTTDKVNNIISNIINEK